MSVARGDGRGRHRVGAVRLRGVASSIRCARWLSPVALGWVFFYSYTKRFTRWCHLVLGVGMSIAPVGGYLAVDRARGATRGGCSSRSRSRSRRGAAASTFSTRCRTSSSTESSGCYSLPVGVRRAARVARSRARCTSSRCRVSRSWASATFAGTTRGHVLRARRRRRRGAARLRALAREGRTTSRSSTRRSSR